MLARLVALFCACAAIAVSQTADAAPIQTRAELTRALQAARGGEILRLAGGDCGVVVLSGMRFGEPVVVTAADPSQRAGSQNPTLSRRTDPTSSAGLKSRSH